MCTTPAPHEDVADPRLRHAVPCVLCFLGRARHPVHTQGLVLLLAALGPEEASQLRLGPLTPHAVRTLRHIRDFFGVTFSIKAERQSQTIFLTCIGTGIKNVSKKVT